MVSIPRYNTQNINEEEPNINLETLELTARIMGFVDCVTLVKKSDVRMQTLRLDDSGQIEM